MTGESIAAITICVLGYGLEWHVAARTGRRAMRKADLMVKLTDDQRIARQDQILAAALACFARTGYHATTMADVANEAGVSKGTPYLYFAVKETLYVALHDQWDCALGARIDAAIREMLAARQRSPRRVLRALVSAVGAHVAVAPGARLVLLACRRGHPHPGLADQVGCPPNEPSSCDTA